MTATTALLIVLVVGAIMLKDIGIVFEFTSAFASCVLAFIFPGYFCIKAYNKFATE